jgi:hypothetical protein
MILDLILPKLKQSILDMVKLMVLVIYNRQDQHVHDLKCYVLCRVILYAYILYPHYVTKYEIVRQRKLLFGISHSL